MVKKGLIERQSVAHDARLKKLAPTPKSLPIADRMDRDRKRLETILTKDFQEEEQRNLHAYIEKMKNNIS